MVAAIDKMQELQERREKLGAEIREMVKQSDDPQKWGTEQEERFQKMEEEYQTTMADIAAEESRVRKAALIGQLEEDEKREKFAWGSERRAAQMERLTGHPRITWETRAGALAAFMNPRQASAEQRQAAKHLGIDVSQHEVNAAGLFWEQPKSIAEARDFARDMETRAQGTTPDAKGGHTTLPIQLLQAMEVAMLKFGTLRGSADVTRTASAEPIGWPTTNDTSNEGEIVNENTAHNPQDIAVERVITTPRNYSSKIVLVSEKLLQDSRTNWPALVGRLVGERIGRIQGKHFTTGDGTSKPRGITLDAADSAITLGTLNLPTYDEVINLKHSVDPAYRFGASFMFHDTILAGIKKLKDSDGNPIWRSGLAASAPDLIDGDPYVVNQAMPVAAAGKSMLYGDLSKYKIHDVNNLVLRRSEDRYWELQQVAFMGVQQSDGRLLDAGTAPVKYASNP